MTYVTGDKTAQPSIQILGNAAQVDDVTVVEGQPATFSVTNANGVSPMSYQWYNNRNVGLGWQAIPGANTNSYTIDSAEIGQDGFRYYCTITGSDGAAFSTDPAMLTVLPAATYGPPQTGDTSKPLAVLALALASLTGIVALLRRRKNASK